jgi:DNA polymerase-3 subunit beta
MKIIVKSEEFKKKLQVIQGLSSGTAMPVLDHFILSNNGSNTLMATDLTTSIKETIEVIKAEKKGAVGIPRKKLYAIINQLEGEVVLESSDDNTSVKVLSGNSKFKLSCINPADYPTYPDVEGTQSVVLSSKKLIDMIEKTIHCVNSSNDNRYALGCLLLHIKQGRLNVAGTDGHRMAAVSTEIESGDEEVKLLLPKASVHRLKQFLSRSDEDDKVMLKILKDRTAFSFADREIVIRLMEGSFPDYEKITRDADTDKSADLSVDDFKGALRRMLIVSSSSNSVRFEFEDNKLTLSSSVPGGIGQGREVIPAEYSADSLNIAFNARYFLDALNTLTADKVTIGLKDPLSISRMMEAGNPDYCFVAMPMRD